MRLFSPPVYLDEEQSVYVEGNESKETEQAVVPVSAEIELVAP